MEPIRTMSDHLRELLGEVRALIVWDRDYLSRVDHDSTDRAGWDARQMRLAEIQQILKEFSAAKNLTIQ